MGAAIPYIIQGIGAYMQYRAGQESAQAARDQADYERLIAGVQQDLYFANARDYEQQAGLAAEKSAILMRDAEINAMGAETEALSIKISTLDAVNRTRQAGSRIMGSQQARYAKAGVEMEGTPLLVMQESASNIETDVANIFASGDYAEHQALMKAMGYRLEGRMAGIEGQVEQNALLSQSRIARIYGYQAGIGGSYRALGYGYEAQGIGLRNQGTLLTNAANIYSQFRPNTATNTYNYPQQKQIY